MTQQVDKVTGEILGGPEEGNQHRHMIALLAPAFKAKKEKGDAGRDYDRLLGKNGIIRKYVVANPDEVLFDAEAKLELEAKYVPESDRLDFMNLAKQYPDVLIKLAELGLLKLDMTAWKAHNKDFKEADIAKRFIMAGGETLRLEVKKRGER